MKNIIEVPIEIRDRKPYVNKDGNTITPREIKFNDLGYNQYTVVKKLYQTVEPRIYDKKDGSGQCTIISTTVEYKGERVSVNISPKSLDRWNDLPLEDIRVIKTSGEFTKDTGEKVTYTIYDFALDSIEDIDGEDNVDDIPF